MPRVHVVQKSRTEYPGIPVGSKYYWWKIRSSRGGTIHRSLTYPKRSQLTNSPFLSALYDLQDTYIDDNWDPENIEGFIEDFTGEIESLKEECEDSLNNMPEHLQETSDSGILLQERIDALDEWITDLQGIDVDVDEDSIREQVIADMDDDDSTAEEIEELVQDAIRERIDEILEEIKNTECSL